jgi:hypothetical protein
MSERNKIDLTIDGFDEDLTPGVELILEQAGIAIRENLNANGASEATVTIVDFAGPLMAGRQTPEWKAANAFLTGLSNINFNPRVFAVLVELASPQLQARMMECFLAYIDILALKFDEKLYNRDERETCERASRIQKFMATIP